MITDEIDKLEQKQKKSYLELERVPDTSNKNMISNPLNPHLANSHWSNYQTADSLPTPPS